MHVKNLSNFFPPIKSGELKTAYFTTVFQLDQMMPDALMNCRKHFKSVLPEKNEAQNCLMLLFFDTSRHSGEYFRKEPC